MSCCPRVSEPFASPPADYAPLGTVEMLGPNEDLPVYVVGDGDQTRSILVFSDVYGFPSGRHRQVCDELSKQGYYVVMPDLFRGDPPFTETKQDFGEIISKFKYSDLRSDIVSTLYPLCLGNGSSNRKVCSLGFCYGAYLWCLAAAEDGCDFAACASPHPSLVNVCNAVSPNSWETSASKLTCPIMLLNAREDAPEQQPGGAIEKIVSKHGDQSVFKTIEGVTHGWSIRGDLSDDIVKKGVEETFELIVPFFEKHSK